MFFFVELFFNITFKLVVIMIEKFIDFALFEYWWITSLIILIMCFAGAFLVSKGEETKSKKLENFGVILILPLVAYITLS